MEEALLWTMESHFDCLKLLCLNVGFTSCKYAAFHFTRH